MKGYIQGIESENLGQEDITAKTQLWNSPINDCIIESGICSFSFQSHNVIYKVKATSNNDFNFTGTIDKIDFEIMPIEFSLYRNKNRIILIGSYIELGYKYRIIIECS